jgi:hypothetical protein
MHFVSEHPIKTKIDDQKLFIEMLLGDFPYLLEEWEKKIDEQFRQDENSLEKVIMKLNKVFIPNVMEFLKKVVLNGICSIKQCF